LFTPEEESQLSNMLHLAPTDLPTVLLACSFIFQQSAYVGLSPDKLTAELKTGGLSDEQVNMRTVARNSDLY